MNFELVKPDAWMSVDNAAVVGMTFVGLPSNIYIAQWREGRGEVEYSDQPAGLRTSFADVVPYVPAVEEFMTRMPDMTLAQAKKIKIDLIRTIYDSKRQLPYAYAIDATPYTWGATDGEVAAMSLQVIPVIFDGISGGDTSIGALVASINTMIASINAVFTVALSNDAAIINHLNNTVLGTYTDGVPNNINNRLTSSAPGTVPVSGLTLTGITHASQPSTLATVGDISAPSAWSQTIPWTPIELTASINLTIVQMVGIMSGIAGRQQTLSWLCTGKIDAVNALTTVAQVISYNVASGWPDWNITPSQGNMGFSTTAPSRMLTK